MYSGQPCIGLGIRVFWVESMRSSSFRCGSPLRTRRPARRGRTATERGASSGVARGFTRDATMERRRQVDGETTDRAPSLAGAFSRQRQRAFLEYWYRNSYRRESRESTREYARALNGRWETEKPRTSTLSDPPPPSPLCRQALATYIYVYVYIYMYIYFSHTRKRSCFTFRRPLFRSFLF